MTAARSLRAGLAAVLTLQTALLAALASRHRFQLNPDGVAYIELARHYAEGELSLAVSAYWGPLLSWLMAPAIWLGADPRLAARGAMIASALVFALGTTALLRAVGLEIAWVLAGALLAALASVTWSFLVSPDLLMSGLLAAALGLLMGERALVARSHTLRAGCLVGLATLAKPVALPIGLAAGVALLGGRVACGEARIRMGVIALSSLALGALFTAGPWIALISLDRGHLTLSTSGSINHALMAPGQSERGHLVMRTFHRPEPGRITQWEDPSDMAYRYWSPFESAEHLRYQLDMASENAAHATRRIFELDRMGLGVLALVAAFFAHRPWRNTMRRERWRWAIVPALLVPLPYLPLFARALRYYYPIYPLLLAAGLGLGAELVARGGRARIAGLLALSLLVVSLAPAARTLDFRFEPLAPDAFPHLRAAENLRAAGLLGPVAGAGTDDGLYLAFFGRVPFYGSKPAPTTDELAESGAALVVAAREPALGARLARDARLEDLEAIAFRGLGRHLRPFRVYRVTGAVLSPPP